VSKLGGDTVLTAESYLYRNPMKFKLSRNFNLLLTVRINIFGDTFGCLIFGNFEL